MMVMLKSVNTTPLIVWAVVMLCCAVLPFASPFVHHHVASTHTWSRPGVSLSSSHAENNTTLVIVDVENVRGKSRFQWTHEGILSSATEWRNTGAPLALVMDHGGVASLHTGGPLQDRVGVLFSGPWKKADDVIQSLVAANNNDSNTNTLVVTADQELRIACQQSSRSVTFMEPHAFLSEVEGLSDYASVLQLEGEVNDDDDNESLGDTVRREVAIRQELQLMNRLLNPRGKQRQVSRKQRTKLVTRRDRARERLHQVLAEGSSSLDSVLNNDDNTLEGVVQNMGRSYSVESTYERQLLAERLRRRLINAGTKALSTDENDMSSIVDMILNAKRDDHMLVNGEAQSVDMNQTLDRDGRSLSSSILTVPRRFYPKEMDDKNVPSTLLRIITISDTHGYEHELFSHTVGGEKPHLLPPADVLIHCGDFSGSGARKVKIRSKARLDAFLAAQTHIPVIIVLRGNHDPHTPARVLFPRSQALYVTKPMTVTLPYNTTLGLRPFSRRGDILLLPPCDILASHEPPYGILDMTYQRMRAGSMSLRQAVEASTNKPSLWLCGHIHEGRGSVLHTFVDEHATTAESTLVVNAANANAGRANRIVTGPVLIDVVKDTLALLNSSAWTAGCNADASPVKLQRPDSLEALMSTISSSDHEQVSVDSRRLLAVDLGLRTATAVLDGTGQVLQVDDWRFTDLPQLESALDGILRNHTITHVVVEGEDVKVLRIWKKAVEKYAPNLPFARVVAEDWRSSLLLPKERKNKQVAKDAAVLIAKQFWNKKVVPNHHCSNKLTKDAAEAILVGQYAVRVLGWAQTPAVKRYANGNVVRR